MLKKSILLLPILFLFLVGCQHGEQREYGCSYGEKSECNKCSKQTCKKCSQQLCEKCKKAENGKLCEKCLAKSCDKCKKKSACKNKRKSKEAVGLIFPVNNSKVTGWIHFQSTEDKKVIVKAEVSGLNPNQKHGFHIHQYGDCRENGKNVGDHFNPYKAKHGAPHNKEKHLGDLGNLKSNKDGLAFYQKTMKIWVKKLLGRSVIVHSGTDDLKSQPSGNSGTYIGCGVIGRLPKKETSKIIPPVKTISDKKESKQEEKKDRKKEEDKKEAKDSKAAPPVKTVSDKKESKQEEKKDSKKEEDNKEAKDSKAAPPVKTVSDKKESKQEEKKDSKKEEDNKEAKDSKAAPPVKTVSDKPEENAKQESKQEEKKDSKKEEDNNKATEKSKTPSATVVRGKAKN